MDKKIAAAHTSLKTAAVTGTNGKTTTTMMIASIVEASQEPSAIITTLGAWVGDQKISHRDGKKEFILTVKAAHEKGVKTLAMEVVSNALAQGYALFWPPDIAVFTNLSQDHMDVHGSMEEYLAAKAQLFLALPPQGTAILNADDPASDLLIEVLPEGVGVLKFSLHDPNADLSVTAVETKLGTTSLILADSPLAGLLGGVIKLGLTGAVNAYNALAAALAAYKLGYAPSAILEGLINFKGVPGRFEVIGRDPLVIVDFAHNPAGLRALLETGREILPPEGNLICVFGCGGEKDEDKRPKMGAVAHKMAHKVVLTSDNPRNEDPDVIAKGVYSGAVGNGAEWEIILDRREAIKYAVKSASSKDIIFIAGRGPETHQTIGKERIPFSDKEVYQSIVEFKEHNEPNKLIF